MDFKCIHHLNCGVGVYLGTYWSPTPAHLRISSRQKVESNKLIYQKRVANKVLFPHLDNV